MMLPVETPSCPILLPSACNCSAASCISETAAIFASRATAALTSVSLAAAASLQERGRQITSEVLQTSFTM